MIAIILHNRLYIINKKVNKVFPIKKTCVIVKIYFEEAYDSMRLEFLEYMMAILDF